jgi:hypothetical protein
MGVNIDPPRFEDSIVRWWEQKVPVAPQQPADEEREPRDVHDDDSPVNDTSRTA